MNGFWLMLIGRENVFDKEDSDRVIERVLWLVVELGSTCAD